MSISRVWMFAGFGLSKDPAAFAEQLRLLNVTDIVFGVNGDDFAQESWRNIKRLGDSDFHLYHSAARIIAACQAVSAQGIAPHIMTWLHPDEPWMQAVRDFLYPIVRAAGAVSLLLDLEWYWIHPRSKPKRFKSADFKTTIPDSFRSILLPVSGFELGITGYAFLPPRVKPVLPLVSYGIPQAYSVYNEKKKSTKKDGYRPGKTQPAAKTWLGKGAPRIIMGLANYWQTYPGSGSEIDSMSIALNKTISLGFTEVAYWSLPWLSGGPAARLRAKFTADILGTSGVPLSLAARRSAAMSSASRRDFQGASVENIHVQAALRAAQAAQSAAVSGTFFADTGNVKGRLYDFQIGRWNDEA